MDGHINETAPPLVSIGEVKLVQVQIVVWFVLHFLRLKFRPRVFPFFSHAPHFLLTLGTVIIFLHTPSNVYSSISNV
jgi:hypothetical protein